MSASSYSPLSSDESRLTATTESSQASHDPHLRAIVDLAREQLQQFIQQRAEITNRIRTIKQTILGLGNLYGDELLRRRPASFGRETTPNDTFGIHERVSDGIKPGGKGSKRS